METVAPPAASASPASTGATEQQAPMAASAAGTPVVAASPQAGVAQQVPGMTGASPGTSPRLSGAAMPMGMAGNQHMMQQAMHHHQQQRPMMYPVGGYIPQQAYYAAQQPPQQGGPRGAPYMQPMMNPNAQWSPGMGRPNGQQFYAMGQQPQMMPGHMQGRPQLSPSVHLAAPVPMLLNPNGSPIVASPAQVIPGSQPRALPVREKRVLKIVNPKTDQEVVLPTKPTAVATPDSEPSTSTSKTPEVPADAAPAVVIAMTNPQGIVEYKYTHLNQTPMAQSPLPAQAPEFVPSTPPSGNPASKTAAQVEFFNKVRAAASPRTQPVKPHPSEQGHQIPGAWQGVGGSMSNMMLDANNGSNNLPPQAVYAPPMPVFSVAPATQQSPQQQARHPGAVLGVNVPQTPPSTPQETVRKVPAAAAQPPSDPSAAVKEAQRVFEEKRAARLASVAPPASFAAVTAAAAANPQPPRDYRDSALKNLPATSAFGQAAAAPPAAAAPAPAPVPKPTMPSFAQITASAPPPIPTVTVPPGVRERLIYEKDDLLQMRQNPECKPVPSELADFIEDLQSKSRFARPPSTESSTASSRGLSGGRMQHHHAGAGSGPPRALGGNNAPEWRGSSAPQAGAAKRGGTWTGKQALDEDAITLREVKSLLNKIAKENFDRLCKQMLEKRITSVKMLQDVIDSIFAKALDETHYAQVYANLCYEVWEKIGGDWPFITIVEKEPGKGFYWTQSMNHDDPNCLAGPADPNMGPAFKTEAEALAEAKRSADFRRLLLSKCQNEFESNRRDHEEANNRADANRADPTKNTEDTAKNERDRGIIKRRELGNMVFIGELFLRRMVSKNIIYRCIDDLLGSSVTQPEAYFAHLDNLAEIEKGNKNVVLDVSARNLRIISAEDVEYLVRLFRTVGKELDIQEGDKAVLNKYFKFLKTLAEPSKGYLESRIRYLIINLLELRENKWVERVAQEVVMTKEEVRESRDNEELEAQRQAVAAASRSGGRGGQSYGRSGGGGGGGGGNRGGGMGAITFNSKMSSRGTAASLDTRPGMVVRTNALVKPPSALSTAPRAVAVVASKPTPPPSASTPTATTPPPASSEPPVDDAKLDNLILSTIEEAAAGSAPLAETLTDFESVVARATPARARASLVKLLLSRLMDCKESEKAAHYALFSGLLPKIFTTAQLADELAEKFSETLEFLADIKIDAPKADVIYAKAVVLTATSISADTAAWIAKATAQLRATDEPTAKTFDAKIAEATAALSGGAAAPANGSAADGVKELVRSGASDDAVVEKLAGLSGEVPVAAIVRVVLESAPTPAAAVKKYTNALKKLLQNGKSQDEDQAKALAEVARFYGDAKKPEVIVDAFDALYKADLCYEPAFRAWRQSSKVEEEKLAAWFKNLDTAKPESDGE